MMQILGFIACAAIGFATGVAGYYWRAAIAERRANAMLRAAARTIFNPNPDRFERPAGVSQAAWDAETARRKGGA